MASEDHSARRRADKPTTGELTVERLCNQVLACKELDVDSGELTRTTFDLYVRYVKWIADFSAEKHWSVI